MSLLRRTIAVAILGIALVAVPNALAADSAHVSGYFSASGTETPLDLVYGVHGYFKVAGHIDDGPAGAFGLQLDIRPLANDDGTATCPASESAATGPFDNNVAVGNDFDIGFGSGVWNVGHTVLVCFYYHHKDNSVTQTSEQITFRDAIDTVQLKAPASIPAAKPDAGGFLLLSVTGETDHQYAGQIRFQPASDTCGSSYDDTSRIKAGEPTFGSDIANPGDQRFYDRFYAGLNPPGINANIGPIASTPGSYRICSWIGPSSSTPAFATSTTFNIAGTAPKFTFSSKGRIPVAKRKFEAGTAKCGAACTIVGTGKTGKSKSASGTAKLTKAGSGSLKLKLTKKAAKRLKKKGKLKVKVTVVVTQAGSAPALKKKTLTLFG